MPKSDKKPIKNATAIIEKFGGIRPMASKLDIAVTTVQGWKKRDVIPANRRDSVIAIAEAQNIDLSALIDGDRAPQADNEEKTAAADAQEEDIADTPAVEKDDEQESETSETPENVVTDTKDDIFEDGTESSENEVVDVALVEASVTEQETNTASKEESKEGKNMATLRVEKSNNQFFMLKVAASVIAVVVVGGIATALLPSSVTETKNSNIDDYDIYVAAGVAAPVSEASNTSDSDAENQTSFKGFVAEDWSEKLVGLKQQAAQAKEAAGAFASDTTQLVQDASQDFIDTHDIEEKITTLQNYTASISDDIGASALLGRFDDMRNSVYGQDVLDGTMIQLASLFGDSAQMSGQGDDAHVNDALDAARAQEGSALAQTFQNVPKDELKAAATLFAMTQVRSALNRGDAQFDTDLQLLMNMVGHDDAAFQSALTKLAPHARSGVLSFDGLQKELRSVTGEVVASSLSGEDVSLSEKLSARANDILQIEKDGELITGTQTQAKLNRAENLVEDNRLGDAISYLRKSMDAKELKVLKPWISKAEGVLASQEVRRLIDKSIALEAGEGLLGGEKLLQGQ